MGDMGDDFRALKDAKRAIRDKYGVPCPKCAKARPKASPSILLPQQRCKVDGYRDPRPRGPEHSVWEEPAPSEAPRQIADTAPAGVDLPRGGRQ